MFLPLLLRVDTYRSLRARKPVQKLAFLSRLVARDGRSFRPCPSERARRHAPWESKVQIPSPPSSPPVFAYFGESVEKPRVCARFAITHGPRECLPGQL